MRETYLESENFLNTILNSSSLSVSARMDEEAEGLVLNLDGEDAGLLKSGGGELLDALEHIVNQVFGENLPKGERIVCDVQNFRATRTLELKAMARHAAERVRTSGLAFTFGPMNSNERRIIHMELANEEGIVTESIGEGRDRRLKVNPH
jgi:spoIIIJ-associated protein